MSTKNCVYLIYIQMYEQFFFSHSLLTLWLFTLTIIILTINAIRFVKTRNHFINMKRLSITILILLLLSIDPNKVLYWLANEYHQTIENRLCYIIVLIDSSNDITCNHKSIIYLMVKIDSPIVLIMKRLLSTDGYR